MLLRKHAPLTSLLLGLMLVATLQAKPLKVFILAGQSNMQGHRGSFPPRPLLFPRLAD